MADETSSKFDSAAKKKTPKISVSGDAQGKKRFPYIEGTEADLDAADNEPVPVIHRILMKLGY